MSFWTYRFALIVAFAAPIPGEQLPPIYFNHLVMFMNEATMADVAASPFLNQDFSGFDKTTTQANGGKWGYSGIYLSGLATYLEFLPAATPPYTIGKAPLGTVHFGMWIDERAQLPRVRATLLERGLSKPDVQVAKEFHNGHDINWFDALQATFPDDDSVRVKSWVMALYASYHKERFPDSKPEEDGTTREQDLARYYKASKLFRGISRIEVTVNKMEEDQLAQEFAAYGYTIRDVGDKKIVTGPEFELDMVSVPVGSPRRVAISMKLNRAKEGSQVLKIGTTSELQFDGDSAVWYFTTAW
jgi:hypothetical protein